MMGIIGALLIGFPVWALTQWMITATGAVLPWYICITRWIIILQFAMMGFIRFENK